MNHALSRKKCVSCEGGISRLSKTETRALLKNLEGWQLAPDKNSIFVEWTMKNFVSALNLIGKIAKLAEKEGHHPDIHLTGYRHLKIVLSTHAIEGLSQNDFILATKICRLIL